jgi:histidyl-tRNA synthetase
MLQSIRGTKDTLPENIYQWQYIEEIFKKTSELYGYKELRTPIFEKTEVFSRSIGENTDIVNKEMYTFKDRDSENITLRPEMTAALVRSVIQHSLDYNLAVLRLWYFGPFFRYERPQKGRYRMFHQYGAECISSPFPESDAEILFLANKLVQDLKIDKYTLLINSLGNSASREKYRTELVNFLNDVKSQLSDESKHRLEHNPLRVLDSKDENDIKAVQNAPAILEHLDQESTDHFGRVKELLDTNKINYQIDNRLVRGLDYYSHTVFEFRSNALGAQDSFGGGGRYDGLFEQLGGKPTPAVGFAMGVERLLLILEAVNALPQQPRYADVYIVVADEKNFNYASKISELLRNRNVSTVIELKKRKMKGQFKEADKLNVKYTIIIGDNEENQQKVAIKEMESGNQELIPFDNLNEHYFKL